MPHRQNVYFLIAIVSAGAMVPGCAQTPGLGSTAGMSFDEYRARADRDPSGGYVVEWDLVLSSDELHAHWQAQQQGTLSVMNIDGQDIVWDAVAKKRLTYCIGNTFTASETAAIIAGLKAATENGWERMADVDFIHVPAQDGAGCTANNLNVVFDINRAPSDAVYLAKAFFPNAERAGRNVLVAAGALAVDVKWPLANILGHELGHALGLRHEHIRSPTSGCSENDLYYRALTPYDAASIMHYPQCGGTSPDLAFTMMDRTGIASLYGPAIVNHPPVAQLTEPTNGAIVPRTFKVRSMLTDVDLVKAELFVDAELYDDATAPPFEFEVTTSPGAHVLSIKATDSLDQTTTSSVTVTVESPPKPPGNGSGTGPDEDPQDGPDEVIGGCSSRGGATGWGIAVFWFALFARRRSEPQV
jgi:serralysin